MKVVYLVADDLDQHPGLKHKIDGQINVWVESGHEVYKVLHYSGSIVTPDGQILILDNTLTPLQSRSKVAQLLRLTKEYIFIKNALEFIKPDITYTRCLFPAWGIGGIVKYCGKLIFEINSDDVSEYYIKSSLTGLFNRLFRRSVFQLADGLVFVTNELANSSSFSSFTSSRAVIGNGIDCNTLNPLPLPNNTRPQLVFIGSPNHAWHGLDKLSSIASILPECDLNVIGLNSSDYLNAGFNLLPNMQFYGYLPEKQAVEIIARCDIGIGTLALHRKNMHEACPLKSRQYFALGLPMIGAYKDTDFDKDNAFFLELPNYEGNVLAGAEEIIQFVKSMHGNNDVRGRIRAFAEKVLDVRNKETIRMAFFKQVLEV